MRSLKLLAVCVLALGVAVYGCSREAPSEDAQTTAVNGPSFNLAAVFTETLGDIDVPLPPASGIVANGIGLRGDPAVTQPGTINLFVPGTVVKAFLFWEGQMSTNDPGDGSILANGVVVNGTFVGGTTDIVPDVWTSTYRADITGLGIVTPGNNAIQISGMNFNARCPDCRNDGAGLLVLYDDGTGTAHIAVREGNDYAFYANADPVKQVTVPQMFSFAAASEDRDARVAIFTGSVSHNRPNVITLEVEGETPVDYVDLMGLTNGDDFDTIVLDFTIPAGASYIILEAKSEKGAGSVFTDIPASLVWITAGLAIEPVELPPMGCRVTGGLVDESGNCFKCPEGSSGLNTFTAGGQAGANTALPPQPAGSWTHSNKRGPAGSFVFHAGTASAPEGTEIAWIECNDPDNCNPAREAPAKQIDFGGVGVFHALKGNVPDIIKNNVVKGSSLHYFEVNIDDLGEPGKGGKQDPADTNLCPPNGFGLYGDQDLANCECPDFYRITIYANESPASTVIYEASGYIKGGNFQIHPLTGYDRGGDPNIEN